MSVLGVAKGSFDASRDVQDRAEWLAKFAAEQGYEDDQLTTVGFIPTNLASNQVALLEVITSHMPVSFFLPVVCRRLFAVREPRMEVRPDGSIFVQLPVKNISDEAQQIRVDLVCRVDQ